MYDYLKLFSREIPDPIKKAFLRKSKEPVFYNSLTFGFDGTNIDYPSFQAKHYNLILRISKAGSFLSNSLHSYYSGFNNNNFTITDFKNSIEMISDVTLINWANAKVSRFEAGCNIIEPLNKLIIDSLFSYGTNYFALTNRKRFYGVKCDLENFYIKVYNKYIQTLAEYNPVEFQMRNEYGCKRVDKEFPQILSVKQLYDLEIANEIRLKFLSRLQKIVPLVMFDYSNLSLKEITILRRYSDPKSAEIIKKISPHTYKTEISIYRKLIAKMDNQTMKNYIQKIADKTEELIYS